MTSQKVTREFFIPTEYTLIRDDGSDAIAYLYVNSHGYHGATVFFGKRISPEMHACCRSEAERDREVASLFTKRQRTSARKAA